MIELGHGAPIVIIPGLPGPWRFIAPAVRAVSAYYRVLTMSLGPECTLDSDVERIRKALDERGIDRAFICGISLGGLVALRFAATYPGRTHALILTSTPGPGMRLKPRYRLYARWPWLLGWLLLFETPYQLRDELGWPVLKLLWGPPVSLARIARRARLIESTDIAADCAKVMAPTLVLTGERAFDHVVPIDRSLEYLKAIPASGHVTMRETGHLGTITRPELFRAILQGYIEATLERTA